EATAAPSQYPGQPRGGPIGTLIAILPGHRTAPRAAGGEITSGPSGEAVGTHSPHFPPSRLATTPRGRPPDRGRPSSFTARDSAPAHRGRQGGPPRRGRTAPAGFLKNCSFLPTG